MDYTARDKPGAPHEIMRNAFVDISIEELHDMIKERRQEIYDAEIIIKGNRMELDTIEWELSYR